MLHYHHHKPNIPPVPPHTFSSKLSSPGPSLCLFPLCPSSPWTRAGRLGRERKKSQRSLRSFFQCNTGKRPLLFVIPAASRGFFVFHALPIMFFPLRKKTDVHTIPNPPWKARRREGRAICFFIEPPFSSWKKAWGTKDRTLLFRCVSRVDSELCIGLSYSTTDWGIN